jgi:hypothetical protein
MPRDKAFLTELETHLRELRVAIKKLERAANTNGDSETQHGRRIVELKDELRTVEEKLDGLKTAKDDALFDEIKLGAQVAWNKLNETYLEALTELK